MKKLLAQFEVIDYYFSKIENYLGKKHQNLLHKSSSNSNCGDSIYSGSPRSTTSDRQNTYDEESKEIFEEIGTFDNAVKSLERKDEKRSKVAPSDGT
jgi:hypothetical protein